MELCGEEGLCLVHDAFVGLVVGVGEQSLIQTKEKESGVREGWWICIKKR